MLKPAIALLFGAVLLVPLNAVGQSQEFNELPLEQLERQLNAILKTRLPEEKKFVADVVKLVKEDKLPRRFVNASFKYVRNKRPNTKSPFVYFVRVLQFLGKRERVAVPVFDFKIYSTTPRQRLSTTDG